jgi:hypothetical protein
VAALMAEVCSSSEEQEVSMLPPRKESAASVEGSMRFFFILYAVCYVIITLSIRHAHVKVILMVLPKIKRACQQKCMVLYYAEVEKKNEKQNKNIFDDADRAVFVSTGIGQG